MTGQADMVRASLTRPDYADRCTRRSPVAEIPQTPRFLPTGNGDRARRLVAAEVTYRALKRMGARLALRDIDTGHVHGPARRCRVCPEESYHVHAVYCAEHRFSHLPGPLR